MNLPPPPLPAPTPETQHYWDEAREGRLSVPYCLSCSRYFFYPRSFCRFCGSAEVEWRQASGRARLLSYVINHRRGPEFEPYSPVIALVELEEGVTMMTNIVGVPASPEHLVLDMPLTVTFEERSGAVLPVFQPGGAR